MKISYTSIGVPHMKEDFIPTENLILLYDCRDKN